MSVHCQI